MTNGSKKTQFYKRIFFFIMFAVLLCIYSWVVSLYALQEYQTRTIKSKDFVEYAETYAFMKSDNIRNNILQIKTYTRQPLTFNKTPSTLETTSRLRVMKHSLDDTKRTQIKASCQKSRFIMQINSDPIIVNEHICKNKIPKLIIMIPSVPSHKKKRTAIRETYGKLSNDKINHVNGVKVPWIVRMVFLLGGSGTRFVDENVRKENSKHHDIVQFDFVDSYYNLTLKMLNGFKWITQYCNTATYVLKCDEDVFVNVALLLKQLAQHHPVSSNGAVFGFIYSGAKVWRFGKWAIDKEVYDKNTFPRYASGTAYVLTVNLLQDILNEARCMSYVQVEDAFITGIIAAEKLGASLVMLNGSSHLNEKSMDACAFVKADRVMKTNLKFRDMYTFWNALISFDTECKSKQYLRRS